MCMLPTEVKLKDFGSECVEVVDNGCGVESANFEALSELFIYNNFSIKVSMILLYDTF